MPRPLLGPNETRTFKIDADFCVVVNTHFTTPRVSIHRDHHSRLSLTRHEAALLVLTLQKALAITPQTKE